MDVLSELKVYDNSNLGLLGLIENTISLTWNRKFFRAGYFRLVVPATENNIKILRPHNLIEKLDSPEIGIIIDIKITSNIKTGNVMEISGMPLGGLIEWRVIMNAAENDNLLTVIDKQMGNAASINRRFANIEIDKSVVVPSQYNDGFKYQNLGKYAENRCREYGCGIFVEFFQNPKRLILKAKYGVDRSVTQSENPRVIFSKDYDNLTWAEYNYSETGSISTVAGYVKAINNDNTITPPREYVHRDNESGYNRKETAIEVQSITEEYELKVVAEETRYGREYSYLTAQRIVADPTQLALQKETAAAVVEPIVNVNAGVSFKSGNRTKYDLGDLVTIDYFNGFSNYYNFQNDTDLTRVRITEVTEYYEKNGTRVEPIFGDPRKEITDYIKVR